ncbi:MAG: transposase [Acidobacteria bacterium]|nr:transposase [Acidobacteriota bacterium]
MYEPRGWHSRGYLPHFDDGEKTQFLTFRLADSMPAAVLEVWRNELVDLAEAEAKSVLQDRIERYLDSGYGKCYLRDPEIAGIVQNALLHHKDAKYKLFAWTIMPNHVHVLLKPLIDLSAVEHSIKSYTANEINKLLGRKGKLWREEVFDRYIRDDDHFCNVLDYIDLNPVKAVLCDRPEDWPFGSANYFS